MKSYRLIRFAALTALGAGLGGITVGCRSAVSTHVIPCPDGVGWETKRIRGVPVTVKLPTHLEVRIIERRYIDPITKDVLKVGAGDLVTKHVEYYVREKDEVFLVDSVKPASGTLTYKAEFDGQFFKSFNSKIEDNTIEKITEIVKGLPSLKPAPKSSKAASATTGQAKITEVDKVVAVKVFSVRDSNLENQVHEFANLYLNDCTPHCAPANPSDPR